MDKAYVICLNDAPMAVSIGSWDEANELKREVQAEYLHANPNYTGEGQRMLHFYIRTVSLNTGKSNVYLKARIEETYKRWANGDYMEPAAYHGFEKGYECGMKDPERETTEEDVFNWWLNKRHEWHNFSEFLAVMDARRMFGFDKKIKDNHEDTHGTRKS